MKSLIKNVSTERGIKFVDQRDQKKKGSIKDKKKINLKNLESFLKDILDGKIDNRVDAKQKYIETIIDDYLLLEKDKPQSGCVGKNVMDLVSNTQDIVFGVFLMIIKT